MAGKIKVTLTAAPSGKSDSFSMSVWAEAAGRVLPARRWRQQRGEEPVAVETVSSQPEYNGTVIKVRVDTVALPDGSRVEREVVDHAGSVAIVTIDDRRRVLLIRQYRHPAGQHLWEVPAGPRDEPGEQPLDTARRELAEETGLGRQSGIRWSTCARRRDKH